MHAYHELDWPVCNFSYPMPSCAARNVWRNLVKSHLWCTAVQHHPWHSTASLPANQTSQKDISQLLNMRSDTTWFSVLLSCTWVYNKVRNVKLVDHFWSMLTNQPDFKKNKNSLAVLPSTQSFSFLRQGSETHESRSASLLWYSSWHTLHPWAE